MNPPTPSWFLASADGGAFLLVPIVVALAGCAIFWHFSRSRSLLERWADENGYEILESEYRNLFKGPFFFWSSEDQTVYRVKVRDREGQVRSGWVRCGGWFLGLWSN